jgi:predicted permease
VTSLEPLLYDARFAARALRREPILSVAMILVLAVALALNVTTFRVMDATLFTGYPLVQDNERLLFVDERYPTPACCVTYADFEVWRAEARSFQDMAFAVFSPATVSETADAARDMFIGATTANSFRLLGVPPALGRDFVPADEAAGAESVAIVSYQYWLTRLGGSADAIGRVVQIDGTPTTIVGVMPRRFDFPQRTDVWVPLEQTAQLRNVVGNGSYAFGRLAPGATEDAARAEVEAINARLAIERPATNRDVRPVVSNFKDSFAGYNGTLIYGSLWAGGWLVLAIACANLANLALARAQGRAREISTRLALGAGRRRVARQWLIENLVLAAVAAALAWWVMATGTRVWAAATETPYRLRDFTPDLATFAYLAVVAIGAAAVITLAPLSRLRRLDVNGELKGASRSVSASAGAKRLSAALVAGQMTLAIVLMSGAGVLGHSLWNVLSAPIGVETPENVLVGRVELSRSRYPTPESRGDFFASLSSALAATPGVQAAAIASALPAEDYEPRPVELEQQDGSRYGAPVIAAGPGYFRAVGAPVLVGRDFDDRDQPTSTPVAIVNERFANAYFPDSNAVGQRIRLYVNRETAPGEWLTIVGVTANVMQNDTFRQQFAPVVYRPFAQEPTSTVWLFARAPTVFDGLGTAIRSEVARIDVGLEILGLATLKDTLGFGLTQGRDEYTALSRQAALAPIFAGIALLLAAIGLYAVVARSVGQRTKEIGVRVALGAVPRAIRRLVLLEGMAPVVAGLVLGLAASFAVNRVLQSQLVGVSPYDPLTLTLAPALLFAVALLGCAVPLRRAVRVSPVVALRHD